MPTAKGKTLPRIINMMQLIPIYPRWTTAKILQSSLEDRGFSVTKRTVERDLVEVADLFGLVSSDSPDGYKWSFSKQNADTFLPAISAEEALSLQLVEQHLEDYFPKEIFSQLEAIFKKSKDTLLRSDKLQNWPNKIASLPHVLSFTPQNINEDIKTTVTQGILEQKKLKVTYSDTKKTYTINPLGMLVRDAKLVLICTMSDENEPWHLLFHRISQATLLDTKFETNFDAKHYAESGAVGVLVNADLIDIKLSVKGYPRKLFNESLLNNTQAISDELVLANKFTQDYWQEVSIRLPHTLELENWLMGHADDIKVIEPEQLKARVIRRLIKSLNHYDIHAD